jgi:alkanesulfonate monooxygenase SsuD/methylene tetrahydromethanopterin reductase-like flavin-dependent oxidoreductase (luciferase family)
MGCMTFICISEDDPDKAKLSANLVGSLVACRPQILKRYGIEMPRQLDFINNWHNLKTTREFTQFQSKAMAFCQENVPESVRMSTLLAGTPDEIISQIETWIEVGCEHFGLQFLGSDYFESVKLFTDKVIPHFIN